MKTYTQEQVDAAINAEREKVQGYIAKWRDSYAEGSTERALAASLSDDLTNWLLSEWADEAGQ